MLGRLLMWSAGRIKIRVQGAATERFLNVCVRGGIELWNVVRIDARTLTAVLSLQDFYRLRGLMGRTGCRVHVLKRAGLPFWGKWLKMRPLLAGGAVGLLVMMMVLGQFLWVLEVDAAPGVPMAKLRHILRESGIYEGAYLQSIETEVARRAIQTEIPEAGVITITKIGNAIRVAVQAAVPTPRKLDRAAPTGLVAERAGVISKATVTGGELLVKPGDAVEVGTLLVSSAVPNTTEWGVPHRTHGMGRVMAYTSRTAEFVLPLTWIQKTPTDKVRTQYALIFGNRRINLYLGSGITAGSCDKIIEKTRLSIGSRLMLPILLVRQTYQVQDAVLMTGDAQQVGEAAAKRFLEALAQTLDGTILESSWQAEEVNGAVRVRVTAACEEQIAAEMIDNTPLPEKPEPKHEDS